MLKSDALPSTPTTARWVRLLALFTLAGFVETVFYGQLSAFTPLYLPHLGVPPENVAAWVGAIASITSIVGILFLPLWGALADRYARQPVIVRSFLVELIAAGVMLLAGNIWVFVIARTLTSLSLGNSGLMMATLSERAPQKRMGLAFAIMNGAPPVGAFLGPLASGPILDRWGFPALMLIDCGLLLAISLLLAFGYRDTFKGAARGPLLAMAAGSLQIITRTPALRTLFLALILLFGGWTLAFTFAPLAVTRVYQGSQPGTAVGLVLGLGGMAALLFSPLVGLLADRFGHVRIMLIGVGLAVMLWPLLYFTRSLAAFSAVWLLVAGVVSATFAISFSVLSATADSSVRGRVMSFAYLPMNLGFLVGPALGSLIARRNVFLVYPLVSLLMLLGLGVLAYAWRTGLIGTQAPGPSQAS